MYMYIGIAKHIFGLFFLVRLALFVKYFKMSVLNNELLMSKLEGHSILYFYLHIAKV